MKTQIKFKDNKLNEFQIKNIVKKYDDILEVFYLFKETNNEEDFIELENKLKSLDSILTIYNSNNNNSEFITNDIILKTENKRIKELEYINESLSKRLKEKQKIINSIEDILSKDNIPL